MTGDNISAALGPAERRHIQTTVEDRLRESNSAIMATADRVAQFRAQISAVLDDIDAVLADRPVPAASGLSGDIGVSRARSQIPPVESVHAAHVLFEESLTVLLRAYPDHAMPITIGLHRSIMERMSRGAATYLAVLLQKVQSAEYGERKRLARELHDRAAHGVGVALQSLDLFELENGEPPGPAKERLRTARQAMHDAIDSIRTIATELRDTLGGRDLHEAITSYLNRFAPPTVRRTVRMNGDPTSLPDQVAQELYLVLREAVHNTLMHADAAGIDVDITITAERVTVEVGDDGIGFDVSRTHGTGLVSMRERLELLGGTLSVSTAAGRGAYVRASLPLTAEPT